MNDTSASEAMQERRWYTHSVRQYRNSAGYVLSRSPDNRWFLEIILPEGLKRRLFGVDDYEAGLRAQDFCSKHDTRVKICLAELDLNGNLDLMEALQTEAVEAGELPRRRIKFTIELEVETRDTDEATKNQLMLTIRQNMAVTSALIKYVDAPRIKEPRPVRTDL